MSARSAGVLDTSVLIGLEAGRQVDVASFPDVLLTTVITQAEIEVGVLSAPDVEARSERLATLEKLRGMPVIPVTADAAHHWARLRVFLAEKGRRMEINDLWIAAIATANELPIVTQDADFDALDGVPGVTVIRV
ncbi:PIN domain-containing protein [Microbacterium sp.]|uniref:PIN domain-containing protein n=1 Tax=Microbacterium sp. TaxID=51671 RepID=UPI0039E4F1F6